METETKNYDDSAIFQKELQPLLDKLHEICESHEIPYALLLQYGQADDPTNPDTRSRAVLAVQAVTIPERTCPVLQAVAMIGTDPRQAAISLVVAAAGTHGVEDRSEPVAGNA